MSEHLEKAKRALADAKLEPSPDNRARLLDIAMVQAQVAQAEALENVAFLLENRLPWTPNVPETSGFRR